MNKTEAIACARELARKLVKDELRRKGHKVSSLSAYEITRAANKLLKSNPRLLSAYLKHKMMEK